MGPDANPIRKSVNVRQVTSVETLNSVPKSFRAGDGAEEPNVLSMHGCYKFKYNNTSQRCNTHTVSVRIQARAVICHLFR